MNWKVNIPKLNISEEAVSHGFSLLVENQML